MLKGTSSSLAQSQGFHVMDLIPLPCPRWQAYKGEKYGYIPSLRKGHHEFHRITNARRGYVDRPCWWACRSWKHSTNRGPVGHDKG